MTFKINISLLVHHILHKSKLCMIYNTYIIHIHIYCIYVIDKFIYKYIIYKIIYKCNIYYIKYILYIVYIFIYTFCIYIPYIYFVYNKNVCRILNKTVS